MEETTTIITGTLTPPPLSSSSDHPNDSLHSSLLSTLTIDLVEEILCRLPVKSLLQLRCLCKSLKTLISDPKFTKKHLRLSPKIHHLILTSHDYNISSYPLQSIFNSVSINATQFNFPLKEKQFSIVGSCDGIVCLVVNRYSIVLWNPFIQKFKELPSFKDSLDGNSYSIAYDFGYDPLVDNYLVAVLSYTSVNGVYKHQLKVHTLGTNSWRRIEGDFPFMVNASLKYVSGALNWFTFSDEKYNVVSFDLANESYQKLLLPNNIGGFDECNVSLGVFRECLCIVASSRTFSSVWLMKEYGNEESWTQLFNVPCHMDDHLYFPYTKAIWIFDDDQVLLKSKAVSKKKFVCYDFKSGTFQIPSIHYNNGLIDPEVCVESLISPCF